MARDLLDRIRGEISERMRETRAAYEESLQLERALAALERQDTEPVPRRSSGKGKGRARRPRRTQRDGRRVRRGANREAVLAALGERPDSTAREVADATGIARTTVASTHTVGGQRDTAAVRARRRRRRLPRRVTRQR